jgi:hypothetical protein
MAHQQERSRGVIRVILEQDAGFTAWLSDQMGALHRRFNQLESTMATLEEYITEIKAAHDVTAGHVEAIKADVTELLTKIASIPVPGLTDVQEALLKEVSGHAQAIAASVGAVDAMVPAAAPVSTPEPAPAPVEPVDPSGITSGDTEPAPDLPKANPASGL